MKKRMRHFTHVLKLNDFKFQKDTPNERNAFNRTNNSPCQNWPQRSKRFNQPLKSKIQPQTALADRLIY